MKLDKAIKLKKFNLIIFYILLMIIFFSPSSKDLMLNGLPFDNPIEIICITICVPIIVLKKFYKQKFLQFIFLIVVIIKMLSFYTPDNNFKAKQYLITNSNDRIEMQSYNSIFHNGYSLISNGVKSFKQMPFVWINIFNPNGDKDIGNNYKIEDYSVNIYFSGYFKLEDSNIINFDFKNINYIKLLLVNETTKKIQKEFERVGNYQIYLPEGTYKLTGNVISKSHNTWFDLKDKNNNLIKIYSNNKLDKFNLLIAKFLKYFEIINLLLFISYLVFNLLKILKNNIEYTSFKNIEFINLFFFVFLFLYFIYFDLNFKSPSLNIIFGKSFLLSLYLLISVILNFFKKPKYNFFTYVFLPTLFFFLILYYENISNFTLHSKGNDWLAFESFTYDILIKGEILRAGEDFFYFRPLMRYIYSLLYLIFGQSFFPFQIFEIYAVLLSSYVIIYLSNKSQNSLPGFFYGVFFLVFIFGETFKINLGKGLTEYYSLSFLCIFIYLITKKNNSNFIYFASIFAAFGFWLREDHFPISLICSLLIISNFRLLDIKSLNFKKKFRTLIITLTILTFYFTLLLIRNYIVGGAFKISHFQVGKIIEFKAIILQNIYPLIAGNTIEYTPRTFSLIIVGAICLSFFKFIKYFRKLYELKISYIIYSLMLLTSILPYFYVANNGYPPRYSIIVLFFSILVFATSNIRINKIKF